MAKLGWISMVFLMIAATAMAEDKLPNSAGSYKGSNASAGAIINTGNTDSQSYNLGINIAYVLSQYTYTLLSTFQRVKSQSDGVTAQKFYLQGKLNYSLNKFNYIYTMVDYTDDRFDGYNYVLNQSMGYGHRFFDGKLLDLDGFLGPGLQEYKLKDATSGNKYLPSVIIGTTITWFISDKSNLKNQLQTTASKQNTRTSSNLTLTTNITHNLDIQLSYNLTYDSKPNLGKSETNTITTLQLVYNFS